MSNNKIYVNSKIKKDVLDEIRPSLTKYDVTCVKSKNEIHVPGETSGEIISAGKKIIYMTETKNQLKVAPACKGGFCPGFKKLVIASNGCPYSCEYCFLQATYRTLYPYIKINCNVDDLIKELQEDISKASGPVIYNAGEMLDSLALDEFTRISSKLVPFFAEQKQAFLLLLTKSANVKGLEGIDHHNKTIVSWSINCDEIIGRFEHGTATLDQRINAARKCQEWGYPIRFRFDPLIIHERWHENYIDMVDRVLKYVKPEVITLGTLRFAPSVKGFSQSRFDASALFEHEFTKPHADGKRRYPLEDRLEVYSAILDRIRQHDKSIKIGLCKEHADIWEALNLPGKDVICNCLL